MPKVTLAEIVAKWERQLHELEQALKGFEVHADKREGKNVVPIERTQARIEMMKEHIRELQQYALSHAR